MAQKLRKLTLTFDEKKENWKLREDKSKKLVKSFPTKTLATQGGSLKKTLGKNGGSVKIQTKEGDFQEERTYPKSKDPINSKG
ncbi:MAG: DUF2188 domain-containing protein [Candidatus Moranbacteria bacterium]|nr:DUF2188 domain-containing protein [Candidatus Moranbacteria bacterium]